MNAIRTCSSGATGRPIEEKCPEMFRESDDDA
jgi:hypothetical protein